MIQGEKLKTIQEIETILHSESIISHCRINIINGVHALYKKYKEDLKQVELIVPDITVKCYTNVSTIYHDLFSKQNFMDETWFNLFVFNLDAGKFTCTKPECPKYNKENICDNPIFCEHAYAEPEQNSLTTLTVKDNLLYEISNLHHITNTLQEKLDFKFYSMIIVSTIQHEELNRLFQESFNIQCPIPQLKYIDYNFDGLDILKHVRQTLYTHSEPFLHRWARAISKFEQYQKQQILLTG
jgi:hypothetical protein